MRQLLSIEATLGATAKLVPGQSVKKYWYKVLKAGVSFMTKIKEGDKVFTTIQQEPYYSGYEGLPKTIIPVGAIGIVGTINVPAVRSTRTFTCVDFIVNGRKWRGAYHKGEIKRVRE